MLVILVLGRLRQENHRIEARLSNLARPSGTYGDSTSKQKEPGMVVHACNPSTWEAETGGSEFTASLSYLVRPLQLSETLFQNKK